jgi:hypothetical protein
MLLTQQYYLAKSQGIVLAGKEFFTFDLEREFLWNQVRNSNTLLVGTILRLPEH